jgi:predicted NBD/HSP70 family sugar kinase
MYLGVDIGGTKTLVASLDDNGVIQEQFRFPTPKIYNDFLRKLSEFVAKLSTNTFTATGVGAPGKIDREEGVGIAFGNLPWHDVDIAVDVQKIAKCPVVVENDANLAGLSESMLLKQYQKVLYVTISTGINTGFIVNQQIEPNVADSEAGHMMLEHDGELRAWEDFASGRAIVARFGKRAADIDDASTWKVIAHDISLGLIDLIALLQPEVIVLGGGVSTHFNKFGDYLKTFLKKYDNPLITLPELRIAARPEQAVIYGCYDLAKAHYGTVTPIA